MCVIIIKPAGVKLPSFKTLNACHAANPDGCGFCTPRGIFKSLSYSAFKRALRDVSDAEPCIIHFRYATHGSVSDRNCHPFASGGLFFAHNGVLPITPRGDMTDSETCLIDEVRPLIDHLGFDNPATDIFLRDIAGFSRFAIMKGDQVKLIGDFYRRHDDPGDRCLYSNLRFEQLLNARAAFWACA
ncbi:MAG: class II glutamine amidotransferase [Bacteroidales bacterium]|nr:class II glutamine amidotransferase [Bacteroidales bacterium]